MNTKSEKVACGKFLKPFGVGGELKFRPYFPEYMDLDRLLSGVVRKENAAKRAEIMIASARPLSGGIWAVRPDGCGSPESAREFTDSELFISRILLKDIPEDEYLADDIVGCEVYDGDGKLLGVVTDIIETGANDVWAIASPEGREILIPAIKDVIVSVGPGKITINVLDGLLD